ncbi:MAG: hypothetical protein AAGM67_01015 [Bacteroidota bacterium]
MALVRVLSEFTFQSGSSGIFYYFTISVDQAGRLCVKNILTPTGAASQMNCVPEDVFNDIQTAIGQVEDILAQSSVVNGNLTFTAETSQTVTFTTAFSNTNYRVHLSLADFITARVVNKTTTGFTIETGTTYTGVIGYDVLI